MTTIRRERDQDIGAIRRVNLAAFECGPAAELVDRLRERGRLIVSLVAESEAVVVGHIAFSAVALEGNHGLRGVGLGPMAVLPAMQRQGIGSMLIDAGLNGCRDLGYDFAVVLGHSDYYPRFGFVAAGRFNLRCAWDVPEDVFMACELRAGALQTVAGLVTYEPEFDAAAPPED